jgi:hypothetical protein
MSNIGSNAANVKTDVDALIKVADYGLKIADSSHRLWSSGLFESKVLNGISGAALPRSDRCRYRTIGRTVGNCTEQRPSNMLVREVSR